MKDIPTIKNSTDFNLFKIVGEMYNVYAVFPELNMNGSHYLFLLKFLIKIDHVN